MSFEEISIKYKEEVEVKLEEFFNSESQEFMYPLLKDFVLNGGKRLRPMSLAMAYKASKGSFDNIFGASICVELLHNSTLVHDDIMDEDKLRRNSDTIFESLRKVFVEKHGDSDNDGFVFDSNATKYGVNQAILGGNVLYSLSYVPLIKSGFYESNVMKSINILCRGYEEINQGQMLDINFENGDVSEEEYLKMIFLKTGVLFVMSVQIGLVLAGADEEMFSKFTMYAEKLALAFQIKDDLMDFEEGKGREVGSDLVNGKNTLIKIKALEMVSEENKDELKSNLESVDDVEEVVSMIKDTGAIDYVKQFSEGLVSDAKSSIKDLEIDSEAKEFFLGLADYVVKRDV